MALRFVDSMAHYSQTQLQAGRKYGSTNGVQINATGGRRTNPCLRVTGWNTPLTLILDQQPTWIQGWAWKLGSIPGSGGLNDHFLDIYDAGTLQCFFHMNTDGTISGYRGNGTLLGTSAGVIPSGSYVYIEFKVTIHASAGVMAIRVNGVSFLNLTGKNTQMSGNATANKFVYYQNPSFAPGVTTDWHDFYVCDGTGSVNNDFLGDIRVDATFPNAAGTNSAWTPNSAVANYTTVDENPATDDTDYNSSSTAGNKDTYNYPAIPPSAGTVFGVVVQSTVRKDDAGSRTTRALVLQGGTVYNGATLGVGDTYAIQTEIFEQDPNTAAPWTVAGVNSAEYGLELVS